MYVILSCFNVQFCLPPVSELRANFFRVLISSWRDEFRSSSACLSASTLFNRFSRILKWSGGCSVTVDLGLLPPDLRCCETGDVDCRLRDGINC